MRIFYDTEFIEDGSVIDLISVGMVTEDSRELYLINGDPDVISRAMEHEWLAANVMPSLPVRLSGIGKFWEWDHHHPDWLAVCRRDVIAASVRDFILAGSEPQLWAWYGAYDHVALMQLWGPMIARPDGIPMWTNDLRQEAGRLGSPELPPMPGVTEHNALDDAREVRYRAEWLARLAGAGHPARRHPAMTSTQDDAAIPADAITAAADGLLTDPRLGGIDLGVWARTVATVALEAAAPHLAWAAGAAAADYIRELEAAAGRYKQLAAEILASYHQVSDGYRGRVGQVQIARWHALIMGGGPDGQATP